MKKSLYNLSLFSILLKGANFWVFWEVDEKYLFIIFLIISVSLIWDKKTRTFFDFSFNTSKLLFFIFFSASLLINNFLVIKSFSLLSYSSSILQILCLLCIASLNKNIAEETLAYITKYTSIILLLGIVVYTVNVFSPLPFIPYLYTDSFGDNAYGIIKIFLFFIENPNSFSRYSGPFLEPGHLATFLFFLLLANKFKIEKNYQKFSIYLSLLMSFSLAGFLLCFIGYTLLNLHKIKKMFLISITILSLILCAQNYENGNNKINKLILDRLEINKELGIIGNNRDATITINIFDEMLTRPDYLLWGYPYYDGVSLGAGYKAYIIGCGIVPLIFLFCAYFIVCLSNTKDRYSLIIIFIMSVLSFIQRASPFKFYILYVFILYAFNFRLNKKYL